MKIKINQTALSKALKIAQNIPNTRTTLPILSHALLIAHDGELTVIANNLDESLAIRIPCEISVPGTTTLHSKKLASIIAESPDESVSITVDSKSVSSVKSGSASFKLAGLPAKDFPMLAPIPNAITVQIKERVLRNLISKVAYCMSVDTGRGSLCGTLLRFEKGKIKVMASDGRRAAICEHQIDCSAHVDLVLPTNAVLQLMKVLGEEDTLVTIRNDGKQAYFEVGSVSFACKVFEESYPSIENAMPRSEKAIAVNLKRKALVDLIRRVSVLLTGNPKVNLNFTKNDIEIWSKTPDIGESSDHMQIDYVHQPMEVGYNPNYLMEPLTAIDDEQITLQLIDPFQPGILRGRDFTYLIMPLRIVAEVKKS